MTRPAHARQARHLAPSLRATVVAFGMILMLLVGGVVAVALKDWRAACYGLFAAMVLILADGAVAVIQRRRPEDNQPARANRCPRCGQATASKQLAWRLDTSAPH